MKRWRWESLSSLRPSGPKGLPIRDGEELLIADQPEDFAQCGDSRCSVTTQFAAKIGEQARARSCANDSGGSEPAQALHASVRKAS